MNRFAVVVSTGLYCGYAPVASGTVGSALGLVVFGVLRSIGSPLVELVTIAVLLIVGVWSASETERYVGRIDPGIIVIDEIVGQWIALLWVPRSLWVVCLAFLLFRFLDITKPWPVSWADRSVRGPLGILLDDVIAGMATCIVVHVVVRVLA